MMTQSLNLGRKPHIIVGKILNTSRTASAVLSTVWFMTCCWQVARWSVHFLPLLSATLGRLVDHLENTKGFNLRSLKYLVSEIFFVLHEIIP